MANVLTGSPIVLDTAGATSLIASRVKIQAVKWVGNTQAGDVCVLHDASGGNVVWQAKAVGANADIFNVFSPAILVKGLYLTTLASGTLLVYLSPDTGG